MSRSSFLRCAGLALALVGTAFVVSWVGARSGGASDVPSSSALVLSLPSIAVFASAILQGVLSP